MQKLRKIISSNFVLTIITATSFNVVGCNYKDTKEDQLIIPSWVYNINKNNPDEIKIGYEQYLLINKTKDSKDPFQQKDWINLNENKDLYLYLPKANNIDEAIKNIEITDSAKTSTIGIETSVTWKKISDTKYTNNSFITQDTSVNGIALMDKLKFEQIKNSNKANTWTEKEKNSFIKYGSLPAGIDPDSKRKDQNWWNANGWEKLLSKEKNLTSKKDKNKKFSQLDLYEKWISQSVIGMNVPLSLIEKESFNLLATKIKHVFLLQSTPKQTWIENTGNLREISTPHWGFTLKIFNQEKTLFQTPQLINLKNAFKEETINTYLKEKKFLSFNSQKESGNFEKIPD